MRSRRIIASTATLALLLLGCGGEDTEVGDSSADDSGEEYQYESPIGEFLGSAQPDVGDEEFQAQELEKMRRVEELTAACMREQGFEYTPVDHSVFMEFEEEMAAESPEQDWGSDEWVARYGFGITTMRYSQDQVGPDLVGHDWPEYDEPEFVDPNQEYVESLGEAEREAYEEALYGVHDEPEWDFVVEEREPTEEEMQEMEDWYRYEYVPTGCMNLSHGEVFEVQEEMYVEFDREFGDLMGEIWERIEASPELVEYRSGVEACVAERGFTYMHEDDHYMYFEDKLTEAELGREDPFADVDTEDWTDEQWQQAWEEYESRPLSAEQLSVLAELQEEEIAMAVAFHECGGGWQDEQEIIDPVRIELERQFLEDHADELAPYEGVFASG